MHEHGSQKAFWDWFVARESELCQLDATREADREKVFGDLATKLSEVHPDLTFEIGPVGATREFVISAGGIKSAFPAVVGLVNSAPPLDRWQIIAFRPRRSPLNTVAIGDIRVDPRNVQFTLLDYGNHIGIELFVPGFKEDSAELKQIAYLMLDETLGEFDVETYIGPIRMLSPEVWTEGIRHSLRELANKFDEVVARIEGRSETPS